MKYYSTIVISWAFSLATAFAPSKSGGIHSGRVTSLNVAQKDIKGYYTYSSSKDIMSKIPKDWGFDPLGLAETEGGMFFMRESEIKHARLAMLAVSTDIPSSTGPNFINGV